MTVGNNSLARHYLPSVCLQSDGCSFHHKAAQCSFILLSADDKQKVYQTIIGFLEGTHITTPSAPVFVWGNTAEVTPLLPPPPCCRLVNRSCTKSRTRRYGASTALEWTGAHSLRTGREGLSPTKDRSRGAPPPAKPPPPSPEGTERGGCTVRWTR